MVVKSKKNTTLGLWKFIFVIAIGLLYLNKLMWQDKVDLLFNGGLVMSFFMYSLGFNLANHAKHEKCKTSSSNKAFNYILDIIKRYYPIYVLGVILAFIVFNIINKTFSFGVFMNSLWEFLGLSSFEAVKGYELVNQPLGIFSNFLLSSFILYYIFDKNEDIFKGIWIPVILILGFKFSNIILVNTLMGVSLGMLSYYVVDYFKHKKFSEILKMGISIMHISLVVFFLYTIYAGVSWSSLTNGLVLYIFFIILMINNDYVAQLYNNISFFEVLDELSNYYYAVFIVIICLVNKVFSKLGYIDSIMFNILLSMILAFLIYLINKLIKKEEIIETVNIKI